METSPTAYAYYKDSTTQTDSKRIKTQVNTSEGSTDPNSGPGSYINYTSTMYNYAGYHNSSTNGAYFWLSSPVTRYAYCAWCVDCDGGVNSGYVYRGAIGVAPAFCI